MTISQSLVDVLVHFILIDIRESFESQAIYALRLGLFRLFADEFRALFCFIVKFVLDSEPRIRNDLHHFSDGRVDSFGQQDLHLWRQLVKKLGTFAKNKAGII